MRRRNSPSRPRASSPMPRASEAAAHRYAKSSRIFFVSACHSACGGGTGVTENSSRRNSPGKSSGSRRKARTGWGKRRNSSSRSTSDQEKRSRHSPSWKPSPVSMNNSVRPRAGPLMPSLIRTQPAGKKQGTMNCGSFPVERQTPSSHSDRSCQAMRFSRAQPRGFRTLRSERNGAASFQLPDCVIDST